MEVRDLIKEYCLQRENLNLFDVNCWIGTPTNPEFVLIDNIEEIKKELICYGVKKAIVTHLMSKEYEPELGNKILIEKIKDYDEFLGAAVVIPGVITNSKFRSYLKFLLSNKVRLIRLFPKSHNFLLSDWYTEKQLSILEEYSIPIILWHTETSWEQINKICSDYPKLNVIVEGTGRKLFYDNRIYYKLLEKFPNFYLEIHNLTNYLGLDDIVKNFGSEKLIFGTYFPFQDPNTSIMPITDGNLTTSDKENIAHRNVEGLIDGVKI